MNKALRTLSKICWISQQGYWALYSLTRLLQVCHLGASSADPNHLHLQNKAPLYWTSRHDLNRIRTASRQTRHATMFKIASRPPGDNYPEVGSATMTATATAKTASDFPNNYGRKGGGGEGNSIRTGKRALDKWDLCKPHGTIFVLCDSGLDERVLQSHYIRFRLLHHALPAPLSGPQRRTSRLRNKSSKSVEHVAVWRWSLALMARAMACEDWVVMKMV